MANTIQSSDLNKTPQSQLDQKDKQKQQGTGFSNINRVLQANQGSNLGNAVSSGTQKVANNAVQQVQQAGQQFQTKAAQAFQPFQGGQQFAQNAIANATGQSDADVNRFKAITNANYAGPQGLENQESLQANVNNLNSLSKQTQTGSGRQALLGTLFQSPQYSQGERRLDSLLLGADKSQAGALQNVNQMAANTQRAYNTAANFAANDAALKQRQAQQIGGEAKQALGTATDDFNQQQLNALKAAQDQQIANTTNYQNVIDKSKGGQISEADAQRLNLGQLFDGGGLNTYGANINDYLTTDFGNAPVSVSDVISQDSAMKANALARLSGSDPIYNDLSALGKANVGNQTLDTTKLQADIARNKMQAEDAMKTQNALGLIRAARFRQGELANGRAEDVGEDAVRNAVRNAGLNEGNIADTLDYQSLLQRVATNEDDLTNQIQSKRDQLAKLGYNFDNGQFSQLRKVANYT